MGTPSPFFDPDEIAFAVHPDEGPDPAQPAPSDAVLGAGPDAWRDFPTEGGPPFINRRLSIAEWTAYVAAYQFGSLAPSRVVLHHTYRPTEPQWAGLNSMRGMQRFYASKGWTSAPHIYTAPDGIWLATPMSRIGIHAGVGNGSLAQGWYSIGLEMVGDFDTTRPGGAVWANTLAVLVGLARRLGRDPAELLGFHRDTSEKSCPGWAVSKEWVLAAWQAALAPAATRYRPSVYAPVFEVPPTVGTPIQVAWGGRAVLTPDQDYPLIESTIAGWLHWEPGGFVEAAAVERLADAAPAYTADSPLLGPTPNPDQAVRAFVAACRAAGTPYRDGEVRGIATDVVREAMAVGLNARLVLAQILKETGGLTSFWSLPPQCNPAGIGVNGKVWGTNRDVVPRMPNVAWNDQRRQWEEGIRFGEWIDGIRAQIGRLLAYALPINTGTPAQQALIAEALGWRSLSPVARGTAPTLKPLGAYHNPANEDASGTLKPKAQWVAGWAWEGREYGRDIAAIATAQAAEG